MSLDKKILSEIDRYRSINQYIMEQAAEVAAPEQDLGPLAPLPGDVGAGAPPPPADAGAVPPPAPAPAGGEPLDVDNDPDVEKLNDDGESEEKSGKGESEELDITELVDSQKSIETKQEEYFNNLFGQLNDLQTRLGEMDNIMNKLNSLEAKIEKYREKTPQEKLELRTYDSYPFNQKLSQFFDDKTDEMEKTGKNEYVLTSDDVTDINVNDIQDSFRNKSNDINDKFKYK
jgi:molecular chaperone GrpE (heat shock protein)